MNEQTCREHETCNNVGLKCMSWTAILAGALVAIGLSFLVNLFGAAIGLSAFRTSAEGVTAMAIGGYTGVLISSIAVMYVAGWIAGYLGRKHCYNRNVGALYGFLSWCVSLVIMALIATQTMQFVSSNLYSLSGRKITSARLYNDSSMMMDNEATNPKLNKVTTNQTYVNDKEAAHLLALSLFLTFLMFFVSAISSAIGGHCGSKPCDEDCTTNKIAPRTL